MKRFNPLVVAISCLFLLQLVHMSIAEDAPEIKDEPPQIDERASAQDFNAQCAQPENEQAILRNPEDCTTFFQCVSGRAKPVTCPDGFQFNDTTKDCSLTKDGDCAAPAPDKK